jgi:preprotein translocase subunit SecG
LAGRPQRADGCAFARAKRYSDRVEAIFSVLQIVISVVLILLVLMHSGKDAGLSGAFGAGSGQGPLGGGSMVERNLNRWTIFFAVLFFLNAILLLKAPWS